LERARPALIAPVFAGVMDHEPRIDRQRGDRGHELANVLGAVLIAAGHAPGHRVYDEQSRALG
jgi:hypothetical protein